MRAQLPDFIRSFDGDFKKHDDQGNYTMCTFVDMQLTMQHHYLQLLGRPS